MNAKAAVILPCRGVEDGLRYNIEALLHQDYPSYEVLLVTTEDDEVLPILQHVEKEHKGRARVVVAPRATACAQKLANQLAAIRAASADFAFFVFVDSDGRASPTFLKDILGPLNDPSVGLSTGWRWYPPMQGKFWTYVRSAWNAGAMPFLVDNEHNIAFGGAMAVRREVFYRAGADKAWSQALSDGLSLARAVKNLGLKVRYEPSCLMVSKEDGNWRDVVEFTNRQATISRVYMPEFWRFTAIAHSFTILLAITVVSLTAWAWGPWGGVCSAGVYLALLQANALLTLRAVQPPLARSGVVLTGLDKVQYMLAAPVAAWLYTLNIIRSSLSREITWRGINYRLEAADRTVVLDSMRSPFFNGPDPVCATTVEKENV